MSDTRSSVLLSTRSTAHPFDFAMELVCLDCALKLTTASLASGLHIISVAEHTSSGGNWYHSIDKAKSISGYESKDRPFI